MKDDSFINLIYNLELENNNNNNLNLNNNMNIINKKKINNINNIDVNSLKINKINNNNRPLKNSKSKTDLLRTKINKNVVIKKTDINALNGGNYIIKNKNQNNNVKASPNAKLNNKPNLNINILYNNNTNRPIHSNNNNNTHNYIHINKNNAGINNIINNKQVKIKKFEKKELNSIHNKQALTQKSPNNTNGLNYLNNIDTNIINNEVKNEEKVNKKNIIIKNKNLGNNNNNLNKNLSLFNTASPIKKVSPNNTTKKSMKHSSLTNSAAISSYLNTSGDCTSISNNKNDQLNLTMNTMNYTMNNTMDINMQEPQYKILSNNNKIDRPNDIFSKEYISNLDYKDYEYDTFCQAIITTGLSEKQMSLSKYSENFPAPCGHELCSKLPALEPNVLDYYYNKHKSHNVDIKQAATSHLIFPLGIKLCVDQDYHNQELVNEPLINTIYNEKGDIYYIASLTYYRKISIKNYNRIFNINPIDVYNKFKREEYNKKLNMNINNNINNSAKITLSNEIMNVNKINNEMNSNNNINNNNNMLYQSLNNKKIILKNDNLNSNNIIDNKSLGFKEDNNEMLIFNQNDIIYIPECLTLVSRFPFFNQLSKCLKIIIYMRRQIINGDNNQKITNNISLFINHI